MAEPSDFLAEKRYAVVTGANKGIGLEICRQLATKGVVVVLTSRDGKRGLQAHENLVNSGINPNNLHYHQLDVTDNTSVDSLAAFITSEFGKLDILVNNAAHPGGTVNSDTAAAADFSSPGVQDKFNEIWIQSYELAEQCLQTTYYGMKRTIKALLPLLEISNSPRIVNVTSSLGSLKYIPNERIKGELSDVESLTEERVDEILNELLRDLKNGSLEGKGWPNTVPAYRMSKAALNAYTKILAKKHPSIIVNCVCPGFVKTDMNGNMGHLPVEEGGASPVRLALTPHHSPSGLFFIRDEVSCV